nr:UDP-2,3-diacylglucosamine diphosphatase [uncultured Rhodoferax sp.]
MPPVDLHAPLHWRQVDFISDLHLQASEPDTHAVWVQYMQQTAAHALFILGDLFEVWVGDDALDVPGSFEAACAETIRQTASRIPVFIMHGNRDFLMGARLAQACKATLLQDPTTLHIAETRLVLTHGDAQCLDDQDYQAFRQIVRSTEWQQDFLSKPLEERQRIAADIRLRSEAQKTSGFVYADVDPHAARELLNNASADTLIHGHTHRPASHTLADGRKRWVLSDWHVHGSQSRAEVLRLQVPAHGDGLVLSRLPPQDCGSQA